MEAAKLKDYVLAARMDLWVKQLFVLPGMILAWVLGLDELAWRNATRRSALRRAKWHGLLRNALVAAGNSGDASLRPLIEMHAKADDPDIAEHAAWALETLAAFERSGASGR